MLHATVPAKLVAVNCCVPPSGTAAADGVTVGGLVTGVGVGTGVLLLPPPHPIVLMSDVPANVMTPHNKIFPRNFFMLNPLLRIARALAGQNG